MFVFNTVSLHYKQGLYMAFLVAPGFQILDYQLIDKVPTYYASCYNMSQFTANYSNVNLSLSLNSSSRNH